MKKIPNPCRNTVEARAEIVLPDLCWLGVRVHDVQGRTVLQAGSAFQHPKKLAPQEMHLKP